MMGMRAAAIPKFRLVIFALYPVIPAKAGIQRFTDAVRAPAYA